MIRILFRHRELIDAQREPLEVANEMVVVLPTWVMVGEQATGQVAYYPIETIQAVLAEVGAPLLYRETWP